MCTRMQRFTTGKEHNPCLVWKEKPIFLIPNRREIPVQFAAPVLDKLRTGAGQVQKNVQEIAPYNLERIFAGLYYSMKLNFSSSIVLPSY